jgi:hypothetical protein
VFLPRSKVFDIVSSAIDNRQILAVTYSHTDGTEIVEHELAPFDIGSTNPKTHTQFVDALWAYSYTHLDGKTGRRDPKVCRFDVKRFIAMEPTGVSFDEIELAELNKRATRYDYRECQFCLLPNRDWFGR